MNIPEDVILSNTTPDRGRGGDVAVGILILGTACFAFWLGFLAGRDASGSQTSGVVYEDRLSASVTSGIPTENEGTVLRETIPAGGQVVASKNGSKYYLPWCGGANTIKEENKVWFSSPEEARAAGYTPAANCKGNI